MSRRNQTTRQKIGTWMSILAVALVILVLVVCLPLSVPSLFGYHAYDVISGSMEPEIPVNSIVFAKNIAPELLTRDDIIVFYSTDRDHSITTHRVVENWMERHELETKGDANAQSDMTPVAYEDVIGKVQVSIPVLGGVLAVLTEARGKIYLVGVLVAAIILKIVGSRLED